MHIQEPYSLSRSIRSQATQLGKTPAGVTPAKMDIPERSFTDDLKRCNPSLETVNFSMQIPLTRALNTIDTGKGQETVGQDETARTLLEKIRAQSYAVSQARLLTNKGNLEIPKWKTGTSAAWVTPLNVIPESMPDFDGVTLENFLAAGYTTLTKQLWVQNSVEIDTQIADDIAAAICELLETAMLQGSGSNQPAGIENATDVNTVTFGGAPTKTKLASMVKTLTDKKVDPTALAWMVSPSTYEKWTTTEAQTGSGKYLIEDGKALDIPVKVSAVITGDKVFLGDWKRNGLNIVPSGIDADLISDAQLLCEVIVNPFSKSDTGEIDVVVKLNCGTACLHPEAFCVSTDSGAQ